LHVVGLSPRSVRSYIHSDFLQEERENLTELAKERTLEAAHVIETLGEARREGWGKQLVERHREEVLAEEKPKIEREVKQKLLRSPEFQHEVLNQIRKKEPLQTTCAVLPPLTPDSDVKPLPADEKNTVTITCPKCGYKFEW